MTVREYDPANPPPPQPGRYGFGAILHAQAVGCWYDSHHVRYCEPDFEHHAKHADRLISVGLGINPDIDEEELAEALHAIHSWDTATERSEAAAIVEAIRAARAKRG